MAQTMRKDPSWWSAHNDSAWNRVKEAFHRDWEQTKHDFGGHALNLNQNVDDTMGQMAGTRPIPPANRPNWEEHEPHYRFGYGARMQYGDMYPTWDDRLEAQLRSDWDYAYGGVDDMDWSTHRDEVRRGWEYEPIHRMSKAA